MDSGGNASLTYTAPKQPKKSKGELTDDSTTATVPARARF